MITDDTVSDFAEFDDKLVDQLAKASNGETPDDFDPQKLGVLRLRLDPTLGGSGNSGRLVSSLGHTEQAPQAAPQVKLSQARPAPQPTQMPGRTYTAPGPLASPVDDWKTFSEQAAQEQQQAQRRMSPPDYPTPQRAPAWAAPPPQQYQFQPPQQAKPALRPEPQIEILWQVSYFGVVPSMAVDVISDRQSMMVIVQHLHDAHPMPAAQTTVECAIPAHEMLYSVVPTGIVFEHGPHRYTILSIQASAAL